ncbi:MAG: DUF59 domain-containing protein [Bacteroidales bacterium]|nr:DUF59 domain-containing protein [Bacteroidales bacterium]
MELETKIIEVLRTVYDPEIPVNIYDLGLIYKIDVDDDNNVAIDMTLTAPNCPIADDIFLDVKTKIEGIREIKSANTNETNSENIESEERTSDSYSLIKSFIFSISSLGNFGI